MRSAFAVTILVCGLGVLPRATAQAQETCVEPQEPAPVDGAQVSEDQMRAAAAAARSFIAQSDVYQACLAGQVEAARTQAVADGRALDPTLESMAKSKAEANQRVKEKVGAEINAAIGLYKKTHLK